MRIQPGKGKQSCEYREEWLFIASLPGLYSSSSDSSPPLSINIPTSVPALKLKLTPPGTKMSPDAPLDPRDLIFAAPEVTGTQFCYHFGRL